VWAPALAFAALAAVPRMIQPGIAEYKLDESLAVLHAVTILHQHVLLTQGQGSSLSGAAQGPLFYYFVAAVLAIGQDPRAVVLAIGLANALAVGFSYVIVLRAFNVRVALLTAVFFAGSSWSIVFSRKIWPNDLLTPLAVVALWGLLRALDAKTVRPGLGWSWLAVAVMGSLNLSAWPLALVPALVQVVVPRTRRGRALVESLLGLAALAGAVALELPTFGVILVDLTAASGHPRTLDLSPFSFIVQLVGTDAFDFLAGPAGTVSTAGDLNSLVGSLLRLGLFLGAGVALARTVRDWTRRERGILTPELLILLWWVTPAAAAVDRPVQVFIHHFLGTVPTQFILVAIAVDWLADLPTLLPIVSRGARAWVGQATSTIAGALAVGALAAQLRTFALLLAFVPAHPAGTYFGVPLAASLVAATAARAATATDRVYILSEGDLVGVDTTPTVMASLANGATFNYLNADRTLVFPDRGSATYFVEPNSVARLDELLVPWQGKDGPLSRLDALSGGYREFGARPIGLALPSPWRSVDVKTADQGVILGFQAPRQIRPNVPFEVDVLWEVGQSPPRPDLESAFAHLVDDDSRFDDGDDEAPMPTTTWVRGDDVLSRFSLTPPAGLAPGRYWIEFGRYQRPGIQPIRLGDPAGPNAPTSVRLGPISIPPPVQAPSDLQAANASFGGQIRLAGWQVEATGSSLQVGLLWSAQAPPATDYTVFVHLATASGHIVAQNDAQPLDGRFPTSTWQTGDRAFDVHQLALAGVPPGDYQLEVGLYALSTGQRLSVGAANSYPLVTVRLPLGPTG
ncbi:MAG: ArnT family glycosyltransferase, partial [Chloroflexota bacterium]